MPRKIGVGSWFFNETPTPIKTVNCLSATLKTKMGDPRRARTKWKQWIPLKLFTKDTSKAPPKKTILSGGRSIIFIIRLIIAV